MKISVNKIEQFIKSPDSNVQFALIYGPDLGLVSERAKNLAENIVEDVNDPFNVVEINGDQLKENPVQLAEEFAAISMMGGRRLIKIRDAGTTVSADVKEIIKTAIGDSFVILSAGDLTPKSSLRAFFEKEKNTAAIPCYKDDDRTLQTVIADKLRSYNMSSEPDVVRYLVYHLKGNRMVIMQELEKLVVYMGDNNHITLEDVENCVAEASESTLDMLINAIADGSSAAFDHLLHKMLSEGIYPIQIIRSLLQYFTKLYYVRSIIAQGQDAGSAIAKLRPPMFFKQVPIFKRHLNIWSEVKLKKILSLLRKIEIECKTTGNNPNVITSQFLSIFILATRKVAV